MGRLTSVGSLVHDRKAMVQMATPRESVERSQQLQRESRDARAASQQAGAKASETKEKIENAIIKGSDNKK